MKKQILNAIYLVVALGTLLAVQSCKKENDNVYKIYATIQQYNGEKMHIEQGGNHLYSCWDEGDKVQMAQNTGTIRMDNNGYYIQFTNNIGYIGTHGQRNNQLYALYPTYFLPTNAQINFHLNQAFNIHLEPTQLYEETSGGYQKLLAPMVAVLPAGDYNVNDPYNRDHPAPTMQFKNLCAMLEVTVNGTGIVVTRIEVENTGIGNGSRHTGRPLWGDYEIALVNNSPILREETDVTQDLAAEFITKEVTLECEHHGDQGGVAVNGSHKFYIFVPPVEYENLHVTVYAKSNGVEKCTTLISGVHSTFAANTMYPLSVTYNAQTWTTVPRSHDLGPFTVNDAGKRIEFAFSNVHHDGTGYFLPPYQYDYIGYHDPNGDHDHIPYTEMLSLLIDDPTSTTENHKETPYVNLGINGYGANDGWMLLTNEEWNYLLTTRCDEENPHRISTSFAFAIVASVPGLLLFPDDYSTPNGLSITIANANNVLAPFTSNIISIPDFYKLENAGCAFLPCVYYTSSQATSITDVGEYWEFNRWNAGRWCSMKTIASGNFGMIEYVANIDGFIRLAKEVPNPNK